MPRTTCLGLILIATLLGTGLAACGRGRNTPAATAAPPTSLPPTTVATLAPTQSLSTQPESTPTMPFIATPPGRLALIIAGGLHVRSGPGTEFDVVVSLVRCTTVYVLGEAGEWVRIEQGFVHGDYITYDLSYPCNDFTPQP